MWATLSSFVAAPAGVAAVITLIVTSFTKTSRLRKEEAVLREAQKGLHDDSRQHQIVTSLHRAVLAQIVARQLTPSWRFVWPVAFWCVSFLLNIQTGRFGSLFVLGHPTAGFREVISTVLGDLGAAIIAVPLLLVFCPIVWFSFVHSHARRAEMALRFYRGESVESWATLWQESSEAELKSYRRASIMAAAGVKAPRTNVSFKEFFGQARKLFNGIGPGLLAPCAGIFVGTMSAAGARAEAPAASIASLDHWIVPIIFVLVFSMMLTLFAVFNAVYDIREYSLPRTHPATIIE